MYTPKQRRRQRESNRRCYLKNKAKRLAWTKQYNQQVKIEVFKHYGGKCKCCGESILEFLAIDHRNGGGYKHRLALGFLGMRFYFWIRRNKYPKNLQILCHNCNQATSWKRECPHKLVK